MLNENNELVMCDFGLSDYFTDEDDLCKTKGSALYFAPEVVKTKIKNKQMRGR